MDQLTGVRDTGELMGQEATFDSEARTSDVERHYGLVLVDLVGLRKINSDFDWRTGNDILRELASRLQRLTPQACVARVDADKFAVLIDDIDADEIVEEGRRLRHELNSATWEVEGTSIPVSVRVTAVSGPSPFPGATQLLWTAQRIHRGKAQWKLNQKIEDLENLVRLNGLQADLGSFRFQLANSISQRDPLTGALNRRGFEEMQPSLALPYALAFVDLDNLRILNESQGDNWSAGDRALLGVKRMLESISPTSIVARWGGDEFVVCLPGFTALRARDDLNALLDNPALHLRVGDLPVTFSGGVTMVTQHDDQEVAMQRAQQCAKDSKNAGRSRMLLAE